MAQRMVSDINVADDLLEEIPAKQAIQTITKKEIESCSDFTQPIVPCGYNAFLAASHIAFDTHRPLVLSPDMIWLAIAQGLACHVNVNSEKLRDKFVDFKGKQEIEVRHDGLVKGAMENPWHEIFDMFSAEIKIRIGEENHSNIVTKFSTTGPVETATNEIVLMDTVKSYFDYSGRTLCGIPEVVLEGTAEDYSLLCDKARKILPEYGMLWWSKTLLPVLEGIALCAAGQWDDQFWKDWYHLGGGSGGPYINGHIVQFFPYLETYEGELVTNKNLERNERRVFGGMTTSDVPHGLNSVPFVWKYYHLKYHMRFLAGFVGLTQNKETKAIRPKIGWAVMEADAKNDPAFFSTCGKCGEEKPKYNMMVNNNDPSDKTCRKCWYNMESEEMEKYRFEINP